MATSGTKNTEEVFADSLYLNRLFEWYERSVDHIINNAEKELEPEQNTNEIFETLDDGVNKVTDNLATELKTATIHIIMK